MLGIWASFDVSIWDQFFEFYFGQEKLQEPYKYIYIYISPDIGRKNYASLGSLGYLKHNFENFTIPSTTSTTWYTSNQHNLVWNCQKGKSKKEKLKKSIE